MQWQLTATILIAGSAGAAALALLVRWVTDRILTRRAIGDLMVQLGFPDDYVHATGETRGQLVGRLVRQVQAGTRSLSGVAADLWWVANEQLATSR